MTQVDQFIFSVLCGTADLVSPDDDITIRSLDVQFDPRSLEFELLLDAEHPLVWQLAQQWVPTYLCLKNLELKLPDGASTLRAAEVSLMFLTPRSEWPEFIGLHQSDYAEDEKPELTRRLLLAPRKKYLQFEAGESCSPTYWACYSGWSLSLLRLKDVMAGDIGANIRIDTLHADHGLISISSSQDFFGIEERLTTALSLAEGRNLKPVFKVCAHKYQFYGVPEHLEWQLFTMLKEGEHGRKLLDQLLVSAVQLDNQKFANARLALRTFLAAKQTEMMELQFLQAMMCVEAMDEVRELDKRTTAALLGISEEAAQLLNCMRNKLVHGAGGYQQAFEKVRKEDFRGKLPDWGAGFNGVISKSGELQFFDLWLRLLERLDAFWCSYFGVPADMVDQRNIWCGVSLLPAIEATSVWEAAEVVKKEKEAKRGAGQVLRQENRRLSEENEELKDVIRRLRSLYTQ